MLVHLSEVGHVYAMRQDPDSGRTGLKSVEEIVHPRATLCGVTLRVAADHKGARDVPLAIECVADHAHPSTCRACLQAVPKKRTHALQPVYMPAEDVDLQHAAE